MRHYNLFPGSYLCLGLTCMLQSLTTRTRDTLKVTTHILISVTIPVWSNIMKFCSDLYHNISSVRISLARHSAPNLNQRNSNFDHPIHASVALFSHLIFVLRCASLCRKVRVENRFSLRPRNRPPSLYRRRDNGALPGARQ